MKWRCLDICVLRFYSLFFVFFVGVSVFRGAIHVSNHGDDVGEDIGGIDWSSLALIKKKNNEN